MPQKPTIDLSPRQREVIRLVADGLCDKEIAEKLKHEDTGESLSIRTVSAHVEDIIRKLKARNRTNAVFKFYFKT